ncbi:hypothetical protein [Salinirubrum litoreum]|uniref:Uncharacterized protein n=1 Tax=Salinirubrum litoreum TaxID=1126234 RepID=A0ABD5RB23_9EURY|nr:hypothetical protein [Salinirubrum litoreum]
MTDRWRDTLRDRVLPEYALDQWRVTQSLVVAVLLIYNAEIVVRLALGAPTVRVAMAYSFLNYPELPWPLAPIEARMRTRGFSYSSPGTSRCCAGR